MSETCVIVGDWGTSSLRLFLLSKSGEVLDHLKGPGIQRLDVSVEAAFMALTAEWRLRFTIDYCVFENCIEHNV